MRYVRVWQVRGEEGGYLHAHIGIRNDLGADDLTELRMEEESREWERRTWWRGQPVWESVTGVLEND
jgi:hypothetical protein